VKAGKGRNNLQRYKCQQCGKRLAGENCEKIMAQKVRNVKVAEVQADEIWGFVQKKEAHKRPSEAHDKSIGDAYTFVAIERDSKLVLNFALGRRDTATTQAFIEGLRDAIAPGSFQVSTDGFGILLWWSGLVNRMPRMPSMSSATQTVEVDGHRA